MPGRDAVIAALRDATVIGIAPRQIALKTKLSRKTVNDQLDALRDEGRIARIGRNLWVLSQYEDITKMPGFTTPKWYANEFHKHFGVSLQKYRGRITFNENGGKKVHRWSPYIQGFSASFVEVMLDRHKIKSEMRIADPFVGSGTVPVCAKLRGIDSVGVEVIPLMAFMARVKTEWNHDMSAVKSETASVLKVAQEEAPDDFRLPFLTRTKEQFDPPILINLLRLRWAINKRVKSTPIKNLLRLAFVSILVDCSRLWRAPCLAYTKKQLGKDEPFNSFQAKVTDIIEDLGYVQKYRQRWGKVQIVERDARKYTFEPDSLDLAITSPPYMNGIDYVLNYKIEMAWLGFARSYEDLRMLRKKMIACDNLSRVTIKQFAESEWRVHDKWLDDIVDVMGDNLKRKTIARRTDMHLVVRKYFEDMLPAIQNIHEGLRHGGRFILVVGDSLISGVYVPTDMILARIAKKAGFSVESIQVARQRRSGQRRDFLLRESIVTLVKDKSPSIAASPSRLNAFF